MLCMASCASDTQPVVQASSDTTAGGSAETTTSATSVVPAEIVYAADAIPGLGRSSDAQFRDEFLAAYQVYRRELALHRCMDDQDISYALQVDYPGSFEPLLSDSINALGNFEPMVSDPVRALEVGPVEFTDASTIVVERVNLSFFDAVAWNEDQAAALGDRWWLARYGITLSEIDVAGEEGFGSGGCEANYWAAVESVWDLRNEIRPFLDAYPTAAQEQSFTDCREEFGFVAESLGDLEGSDAESEGGVFEECLQRWDAAGQSARQTVEQDEVVAEVEVRFATQIAGQRQQLADAMADPIFLALIKAL